MIKATKLEMIDIHCCHFNHDLDPSAVDQNGNFCPPLSVGEVTIEHGNGIYILNVCQECLDWYNDPAETFVYLLCLACSSGQWVDKRLSRHRYPAGAKVVFLNNTYLRQGCPKCLDDEWEQGLERYRQHREESKKKND